MPTSYEIEVEGFKFNVICGSGFEDGVSIRPDNADLDNDSYLVALKQAIALFPFLNARYALKHNLVHRHRINNLDYDTVAEMLAESSILEQPDCPIAIPYDLRLFLAELHRKLECATNPKRVSKFRDQVLERDQHHCRYCGSGGYLHLDHVIPKSRGGKNTLDNLVAACPKCNYKKRARTPEEAGMELRTLNG